MIQEHWTRDLVFLLATSLLKLPRREALHQASCLSNKVPCSALKKHVPLFCQNTSLKTPFQTLLAFRTFENPFIYHLDYAPNKLEQMPELAILVCMKSIEVLAHVYNFPSHTENRIRHADFYQQFNNILSSNSLFRDSSPHWRAMT